MIIHSIIPEEIIFTNNAQLNEIETKEIIYNNIKMEVIQIENQKFIINRIVSTNLKHFLIPELQPGKTISLINPVE